MMHAGLFGKLERVDDRNIGPEHPNRRFHHVIDSSGEHAAS
jgi:hypothetical protein